MTKETEKIDKIALHIKECLTILGADLKDPNYKDTPTRVAKAWVTELFPTLTGSLDAPKLTVFPSPKDVDQMLVEKNIMVQSTCAHHLLPFFGVAHIAYFPKDFIIGLSKLHRVVNYYARKPQVQEALTEDILNALTKALGTKDVAVVISATHTCTRLRGVKDPNSETITIKVSGMFQEPSVKAEFLSLIK